MKIHRLDRFCRFFGNGERNNGKRFREGVRHVLYAQPEFQRNDGNL